MVRVGEKCLMMTFQHNTGVWQIRRTDQTDRQTDILRQHRPRYAHASRSKNYSTDMNTCICIKHTVGLYLYLSYRTWFTKYQMKHFLLSCDKYLLLENMNVFSVMHQLIYGRSPTFRSFKRRSNISCHEIKLNRRCHTHQKPRASLQGAATWRI